MESRNRKGQSYLSTLKRAFETIDRDRLILKLRKYGITGKELNWFLSYLTNRTQCTKYNGVTWTKLEIDYGVPQGAKLAAILFLIYINDIGSPIKHCKIGLFADDTLLYISHPDIVYAAQKMNEDLERLNKWLNINKLKLNAQKTKFMIVSNKNIDENSITISIGGYAIDRVSVMKYLGVLIDELLKMNQHVDYVTKKVAKKIGFFSRISVKLNFNNRKTLYKSMIAPHFEYCASILYLGNEGDFEQLQNQQNRAMRIILKCKKRNSVSDMLHALQFLNVKQRVKFLTMVFIQKIRYGNLPNYLSRKMKYVGESQHYNLRNNNDFRLPLVLRAHHLKIVYPTRVYANLISYLC